MAQSNNQRIAKNTMLLYCRMLVVMGIAFFTSRELLSVLGEVDYGLANVIAGVVSMFSFLSGMMTSAASRYFTFEIGRENYIGLKQVFNLTHLIYMCLALIILVLSETVGLWFFNNKIIIPIERQIGAYWFFHFSVVSFLIEIMVIPYHSLVISHENMRIFTLISSFDAIAKLLIIYTIRFSSFDSLAFYGAMLALIAVIKLISYFVVCHKLYPESHFQVYWNAKLFKELLSFSGWNLFGAVSGLFTKVFINVLLNNYFGAAVNAARGVAMQVSTAVAGFMQNFFTAAKPQITKYWATQNKGAMYLLVNRSAKFGFFLMLFMSLPVLFEADYLLSIWLKKVPEYTVVFTRLVIIRILIDSLSYPLMTAAQATGKVALYQSIVGGTLWLNLPVAWLLLRSGYPPQATEWAANLISLICLLLRLILVRRITGLPIIGYFKSVILPAASVVGLSIVLPIVVWHNIDIGFSRLVVQSLACVASTAIAIFVIGLSAVERKRVVGVVMHRISLIRSRS